MSFAQDTRRRIFNYRGKRIFKGVNMQTAPTTNSVYITQLIELIQYYKASMYNELGLNANYNMKRERLNLGEVSMNVDVLCRMWIIC